MLLPKFFKLPDKASQWIPVVSLGLVVFLGWFNIITLLFKSGQWALAILTLGITYQSLLFLNSRKPGALGFLSAQIPNWIGLILLIAAGSNAYSYISARLALNELPSPSKDAPNVILIVLDTLRADHLSAYGYSRETSPNLKKFASEGVLFENAFATSSWTLPSHATIMTGLYTHEHLAETSTGGRLADKYFTLAEAYSSGGYETAAIVANNYACTQNQGFGQGFNFFNGLFWNVPDSLFLTEVGQAFFWKVWQNPVLQDYQWGRKKASDVNQIFLSWLQDRSDRPFFVWLNYFDPHDPYFAPPPFDKLYGNIPASGQTGSFGNVGASDWGGTLPADELSWQMDHYDAAITYLDSELGKLFEALRQAGLYDNTMIVITSDHGEAFGEHGVYGHANSLYRETIQIPLLIRYPEKIPAGERIERIVSLRDLAATVTDLSGLKENAAFPGTPLFANPEEIALAELYQNPYHPPSHPVAHGDLSAINTDQWQAIFMEDQAELYVSEDNLQRNNLASEDSSNTILFDLQQELDQLLLMARKP
jgi:arylsulfatase A-like enzyme